MLHHSTVFQNVVNSKLKNDALSYRFVEVGYRRSGVVNGSVLRGWLSHNEARCDTISACPARVVSAGPPLSTSLAIPNSITDYVMNIPLMFA